jgi:hypothetical protein
MQYVPTVANKPRFPLNQIKIVRYTVRTAIKSTGHPEEAIDGIRTIGLSLEADLFLKLQGEPQASEMAGCK